ncbi:hypothetical protein KAR91_60555 [Candidatus Pacearchaeota archaeon]|nr:hypothetical protein [Candidatus Pacearchaeota archaeon]
MSEASPIYGLFNALKDLGLVGTPKEFCEFMGIDRTYMSLLFKSYGKKYNTKYDKGQHEPR